ncbi:hypothetical protein AOLI_G00190840 [Acnodon oligacanthus]
MSFCRRALLRFADGALSRPGLAEDSLLLVCCRALTFSHRLLNRIPDFPSDRRAGGAASPPPRRPLTRSALSRAPCTPATARPGRSSDGVVKFADDAAIAGQRGGLRRGGQLPDTLAPEARESARPRHRRRRLSREGRRLLGVDISEEPTWAATAALGANPRILRTFYACTAESILTGCSVTSRHRAESSAEGGAAPQAPGFVRRSLPEEGR